MGEKDYNGMIRVIVIVGIMAFVAIVMYATIKWPMIKSRSELNKGIDFVDKNKTLE